MPHPDDEFLFECDLDEQGRTQFDTDGRSLKFTDRAKAAQEAKWKRLDEIYGPRETISTEMLGRLGGNPPRLAYGWAFPRNFYWDYAVHHNLSYDASKYPWLVELAGTPLIKYGELTEDRKSNETLMKVLKTLVDQLVHDDLYERTGIELAWVRPFSPKELPRMLALYNNYDMRERCYEMQEVGGVAHVALAIDAAITFDDYEPELLWWHDWHHLRVGLSTPL